MVGRRVELGTAKAGAWFVAGHAGAVLLFAACSGPKMDGVVAPAEGGALEASVDTGVTAASGDDADTGEVNVDAASDASAPPTSDAGAASTCVGTLYCEDFESYDAGPTSNSAKLGPWSAYASKTVTMTVDGVNPAHGKQSLHVIATPDDPSFGNLAQKGPSTGLVPGNDLFGRIMLYFSTGNGYVLPLNVHEAFFVATAADGTSINQGAGGSSMGQYDVDYQPAKGGEFFQLANTPIAGNKWTCIQWQYDGSGNPPASNVRVWADGMLVIDAEASKTQWKLSSPWTSMTIGWWHYIKPSGPVESFYDDFAIGDAMIPCP